MNPFLILTLSKIQLVVIGLMQDLRIHNLISPMVAKLMQLAMQAKTNNRLVIYMLLAMLWEAMMPFNKAVALGLQ